ncbi:MAG: glycoside hydrolase family 9 protein [Pirellulaceae bacterium]|nr:glycoside hydrolase family 9 protein [Pirellulaceae bacterium]
MRYFVSFALFGLVVLATSSFSLGAEPATLITDFDKPFNFSYQAFEKTATVADGAAHIAGKTGQGGAGVLKQVDLSKYADHALAIWVKVGPKNRAKAIKVFFAANEEKRMFSFSLKDVKPDGYTQVLPEDGLALSPAVANEPDQAFDPATITLFQVQGDWTQAPVDVYLDKIELVPPTPEMQQQRKAHAERLAEAAERKRQEEQRRREEIERLIAGAPHPNDGPVVTHVGAVKHDTIALTIDAGEIVLRKQVPLDLKAGVEIRPEKNAHNVLCLEKGQIVDVPKGREVVEQVEGQREPLVWGKLVVNDDLVSPGPICLGTPLTTFAVQEPRAYRIQSSDDPAYAQPRQPTVVHVKSKPTGQANGQMAIRYQVYLTIPSPLQEHAKYTIQMIGVNTRQPKVAYTHDPRHVRSEAIHVTQIGYRPSDPFKRAYLSLWMGTGGAVAYETETFEMLDADSGQSVYAGKVSGEFPAERIESIRGNKNHTQTNVYYLDFHDFSKPGEYVVYVPGIGVSYPFRIAESVWQNAFTTSMHGFLSHRSGIELGSPFTKYVRPRPMHPDDGAKVFQLDVTFWNGEADSVHRCLRRLLGPELDATKLQTKDNAWGGYMDAGDWDRRSQHLTATWSHLELLDLFPDFFEKLQLDLPPSEADDKLPDVLNEALWNLDFYRRLQGPDGGVSGGVESTSHPRPGEASWQESLLLGVFAPDPETSLRYAACAARAARLLDKYAPVRSEKYAASARRAWTWAEANDEAVIARESRDRDSRSGKDPEELRAAVRNMRALAAVALYRLTKDADYHGAFAQATDLRREGGDPGRQFESVFAYANLPDTLADATLKAEAIAWFEQAARDSIAFAQGNPFSVTCRVPMLPVIGYVGYYTVPETAIGAILPRAHYLTGKDQYLRGALAAAHFSAGANPMNMTFTIGVGHDYPRQPLHVDSQHAGIAPPKGITVYGMSDPAVQSGAVDWAHIWYLGKSMIPGSRTWPTSEAYADLGNWPAMTEYTVHQTFGPTSFYWGYLAARK